MKGRLLSKSKILAVLCCFVLAVATFLTGFVMLYGKKANAEGTNGHDGFYVENGASLRYDVEVPALRYTVVLTKAQYDAYVAAYNADPNKGGAEGATKAEDQPSWYMYVQLATGKMYGETVNKGFPVQKLSMADVHDYFADSANTAPYVKYVSIRLDEELDGTAKTKYKLYQMYSETEVYVYYVGIDIDGGVDISSNTQWLATRDKHIEYGKKVGTTLTKEATNRSARAIATSLITNGKETDKLETQKKFLVYATEGNPDVAVEPTVNKDGTKLYYDNYADKITIAVGADKLANVTKAYVNGHLATFTTDGDNAIVSGVNVKEALTAGKVYSVNFDAGENIYSYNNVIDATEIFYASTGRARIQEVFALKHEKIFINSAKTQETVTGMVDGKEETASIAFYGVDRGYYVLGEDIDFGGAYVSHERNIQNAYNFYKKGSTGSYTDPDGFDMKTAVDKLTGFFGFGGTFDGNGHSITRFQVNQSGTSTVASGNAWGLTTSNRSYAARVAGLFGALAYGATIKDVAFTNINVRENNAHTGSQAVLAGFAGGSATATGTNLQNFLKIKYGTTDGTSNPSIVIDNCYFQYDVSQARATDDGNHQQRNAKPRSILRDAYPGVTMFSNCVFDMANVNPVSINNDSDKDGGYGIIGKIDFTDANNTNVYDDCFSNCYTVSADRDGRVEPVWQYNIAKNSNGVYYTGTDTYLTKYPDATLSYEATGENRSIEVYAKNDAENFGISHGDLIYAGLAGEENNETYVVEKRTDGTANKTAYVYENVYHYKNYTEMVLNNTQSTEGFNDNWVKVGGAVRWKTEDDASPLPNGINVTVTDEPIIGNAVAYSVNYNGTEVDAVVNAYDDEGNALTSEEFEVDTTNKTFTIKKAGVVNVKFEYGNFEAVTKSYSMNLSVALEPEIIERGEEVTYKLLCNDVEVVNADITVNGITNGDGNVLDTVNKKFTLNASGNYSITFEAYGWTSEPITCSFFDDIISDKAIVVSANYLTEEGAVAGYSVPYEYNANGELEATTYAKLYAELTGVASLKNVYTLTDETKAELNQVEGSGGYYYFANPGKATKAQQMVLAGDNGTVTLTNQTIITLVVEDEIDFKYIPSDSTTRAGSYYLAKDFDNRINPDAAYDSLNNSKLNETGIVGGTTNQGRGYSFGNSVGEAGAGAGTDAFTGVFDGLGHTIDYLEVERHGLLGVYASRTSAAGVIKNVMFKHLSTSTYYWDGTETDGVKTLVSSNRGTPIIATLNYTDRNDYTLANNRARIENVVIESSNNVAGGDGKYLSLVALRKGTGNTNTDGYALEQGKIEFTNVIYNFDAGELTYKGTRTGEAYIPSGYDNTLTGMIFDYGATYRGESRQILIMTMGLMRYTDNLVVIARTQADGRTAVVCGTRNGNSANSPIIIGLPENDFIRYFGENTQEKTLDINHSQLGALSLKVRTTGTLGSNGIITDFGNAGWGVNSDKAFMAYYDASTVTFKTRYITIGYASNRANSATGVAKTIFYSFYGVNRYASYAELVNSGAANVGSWAVTAEGITWGPQA